MAPDDFHRVSLLPYHYPEDHPALVQAAVLDVGGDGTDANRSAEAAAESRWRARQLKASERRFQVLWLGR